MAQTNKSIDKNKKNIFQRSWGWGGLAQSKKKIEKTKKNTKKHIPEVLGMGGSHQEFPNIFVFCFFWFSRCFLVFWPKNAKTFGKTKKKQKTQYSRDLGHRGFSPRVSKYCFFFFFVFWFSQCFLISLHGVLPKETQSIFLCYHYMEVYTVFFFSVYGTKWWTDNLKSRQVERVLTKFKGCEPSCRKVQKVAALVGSGWGGDHIYIYIGGYVA